MTAGSVVPFDEFQGKVSIVDRRVQKVIIFMENHLHRELPLSEMAQAVNLSPSRLQHLFKEETGMTPSQYLKSLRVRKASYLLKTTFLSVKEIMQQVGITDKAHFAKDFKKVYGVTPTNYRVADMHSSLIGNG